MSSIDLARPSGYGSRLGRGETIQHVPTGLPLRQRTDDIIAPPQRAASANRCRHPHRHRLGISPERLSSWRMHL